ncbi:MAG: hypothetical protein MUF34_11665 [Polyangiaceae bacterium]|nr:hypothetical protein [Polyangiaceae bacterium]
MKRSTLRRQGIAVDAPAAAAERTPATYVNAAPTIVLANPTVSSLTPAMQLRGMTTP